MDKENIDQVVMDMSSYRPDLSRGEIETIIQDWIASSYIPKSEVAQDVIFSYQRAVQHRLQADPATAENGQAQA